MNPDHAPPTLELRLLGDPQIHLVGKSSSELPAAKAQALLYYLATTQRAYTRAFLAGLLWGDLAEEAAQDNLRKVLHLLRRHLTDHLALDRQTIRLQTGQAIWVDAVEFSVTLGNAHATEPELVRRAIDLYRGDFLEGFYIRRAPEFEMWMLGERARLRELLLQGMAMLAEYYAGENNLPEAITTTRRLLAVEPWREEMHRQLMQWLLQNGQRSAALAQYELCRRALAEELDVAPALATIELYESIRAAPAESSSEGRTDGVSLASAPTMPLRRKHNLPTPPTPFIGREAELVTIQQRLSDPNCRLLTLVGPGGAGKTRLALQAATEQSSRFEHGVYFVMLAALESAQQLVTTLLDTFHLTQQGHMTPETQLLHYLRNKHLLLLLDNFEHLRDGARLVKQVLSAAPDVKLLVTSRERLKLQEEWLLSVAGLALPLDTVDGRQEEQLNDLASFSAIRLFMDRARRVQPAFALTTANAADIIQICRHVEGLPLAIELAAAWLRLMSCAGIVQEINRSIDFLTSAWQDAPPRHQSLRAVFDHSWRLLSPQEQVSLCQLTVFRGGFRPPATAAVAGASLALLADLVDKSWLRVVDSGRFDMHELVRQFAAEKLTQTGTNAQPVQQEEEVRARHSIYYARFLQEQEPLLHGPRQQELLAELLAEVDNIRRGWRWAVDTVQVNLIGQYLPSWQWLGEVRCWNREMAQTFAEAAARLKAQLTQMLDQMSNDATLLKLTLARTLYCQARHVFQLALPEEVQALGEESLTYWPEEGLADWVTADRVRVKLQIGQALYDQGRYEESIQICRAAYAVCEANHNQVGLQEACYSLGLNAFTQGDIAEAQTWFMQGLTIANKLGEQVQKLPTLMMFAETLANEGDTIRAEQTAWEMHQVAEAFGSFTSMAFSYLLLGYIAFLSEQLAQAHHYFQNALTIGEEIGNEFVRLNSRRWLGRTAYEQQRYAVAHQFFAEALGIARAVYRQVDVAIALTGLGFVSCALGEYEVAQHQLQEAIVILEKIQAVPDLLHTFVGVSQLWLQLGNLESATQLLAFVQQHPAVLPQTQSSARQLLIDLQTKLPDARFTTAHAVGTAMTLAQITAFAKGAGV
jgi:predicted ATPase/DNA-binding SARP family transcriptional activator